MLRGQQSLFFLNSQSNGLSGVAARQQPRPFESSRITDQSRYEDHPPPTEDDMISKF